MPQGRRPYKDRLKRNLIRVGDSLAVTIPIEHLEKLGWEEGKEVEVKCKLGQLKIKAVSDC